MIPGLVKVDGSFVVIVASDYQRREQHSRPLETQPYKYVRVLAAVVYVSQLFPLAPTSPSAAARGIHTSRVKQSAVI